MKIGLFPMVADLLHVGHIAALTYAKQHCDVLIVALNVNPCDNKSKHAPIESVYERFRRLNAVEAVDAIIPYEGEDDLLLLLQTTTYHVRFVGEDHLEKEWTGRQHEREYDIGYVAIPRSHNVSSSSLRERVYLAEMNARMPQKTTK